MISIGFNEIISFWFETSPGECIIQEKQSLWWGKNPENDRKIKEKYGHVFPSGSYHYYINQWSNLNEEAFLAAIILVDQFPRHIYRDSAEAYAFDTLALELCYLGLAREYDKKLHPIQRIFFYLPLQHAESISDQIKSVQLYHQLYEENSGTQYEQNLLEALEFAKQHQKIIKTFARFPYRNKIMNRENTLNEQEWLSHHF